MAERLDDTIPLLESLHIGNGVYLYSDGHVENPVDDEGGFSETVNEASPEGAALFQTIAQRREAQAESGTGGSGFDEVAALDLYRAMFAGHNEQAAVRLYQMLADN